MASPHSLLPLAVVLYAASCISAQQCVTTTDPGITSEEYSAAYNTIASAFAPTRTTGAQNTRGDTVGAALRLSFHDAAPFDQNDETSFGVDGCIDPDHPDNAGLEDIVEELAELWAPLCDTISLADFWVVAAKVSVEISAPVDAINIPVRLGRTTRTSCAVDGAEHFPDAELGIDHIEEKMVEKMGLSLVDSVALLGAHTLGRAEEANLGYNGPWTNQPANFNNDYFEGILDVRWNRRRAPGHTAANPKTQWLRNGGRIALNADMEIAYRAVNDNGRCGPVRPNGNGIGCQSYNGHATYDASFEAAREFSNDQAAWFSAFESAMQKMNELGTSGLFDAPALDAVAVNSNNNGNNNGNNGGGMGGGGMGGGGMGGGGRGMGGRGMGMGRGN